jgi:hypothetical protein
MGIFFDFWRTFFSRAAEILYSSFRFYRAGIDSNRPLR